MPSGRNKDRDKDRERDTLTIHVNKSQIGTADNHALAHDETQASRATGNDTDLALERERGERALHVHAAAAGDGRRGRQLALLGILDGDGVISTREGTGRRRGPSLVFVGWRRHGRLCVQECRLTGKRGTCRAQGPCGRAEELPGEHLEGSESMINGQLADCDVAVRGEDGGGWRVGRRKRARDECSLFLDTSPDGWREV